MSIKVELTDLEGTIADFGAAYLLTVSAGAPPRVKAVSVRPDPADGELVVRGPGRGSCANASAHPDVTLVWPPREPAGFSLIVDGAARLQGDDVVVTPASAILHKPAGAPAPPGAAC